MFWAVAFTLGDFTLHPVRTEATRRRETVLCLHQPRRFQPGFVTSAPVVLTGLIESWSLQSARSWQPDGCVSFCFWLGILSAIPDLVFKQSLGPLEATCPWMWDLLRRRPSACSYVWMSLPNGYLPSLHWPCKALDGIIQLVRSLCELMDCTFLLEVFLGTNLCIPSQPCRTRFHICGPFSVLPGRSTESGSSTNRAIAGRFFLLQSCEQWAAYAWFGSGTDGWESPWLASSGCYIRPSSFPFSGLTFYCQVTLWMRQLHSMCTSGILKRLVLPGSNTARSTIPASLHMWLRCLVLLLLMHLYLLVARRLIDGVGTTSSADLEFQFLCLLAGPLLPCCAEVVQQRCTLKVRTLAWFNGGVDGPNWRQLNITSKR